MGFIKGPDNKIIDFTNAANSIEIEDGVATSSVPISLDLPTEPSYAANKEYVDSKSFTLNPDLKLEDIDLLADSDQDTTLTTARTIDNVSLAAGMRVALTAQSSSEENGIYLVQSDLSLAYDTDWNSTDVEAGSWFIVTQGDTYANTGWYIYYVSFALGLYDADIVQFSNADGSNVNKPIMISYDTLRSTNIDVSTSGTTTYTSGTKMLLTGQTDKSENGIWIVNGGPWVRPSDYASGSIIHRGTMFIDKVFTTYISTGDNVVVDTDNQEFEVMQEDWFDARYLLTYAYTTGNPQTVNSSLNVSQSDGPWISVNDTQPTANTSSVTLYKGRRYGAQPYATSTQNDRLWMESNVIYQDNSHDGFLFIGTAANTRANWVKSATNVPAWIAAQKGTDWSISAWVRSQDASFGVINTEAVSGNSFFQGLSIGENTLIEPGIAVAPAIVYLDSAGASQIVRIEQSDDLPFNFSTSTPNSFSYRFYHVVITHTGTTDAVTIHIDSVNQTNLSSAVPYTPPDTPADGVDLIVGASFDGAQAAYGVGGYMSDVMLFDRVLDQDDIDDLYNNGYGKVWTDVVADQAPDVWYKLDETAYTTSDTLADSSTTGTGTLSIEDANCNGRLASDDMSIYHAVIDMHEDPNQVYESRLRIGSPKCNNQLRGALVEAVDGDFAISTNGKGLKIEDSTNGKIGSGTANGTTGVTISNTSVTSDSYIFLTATSNSNLGSLYIDSISDGASFVVKSTDASDASTFDYMIVEPA